MKCFVIKFVFAWVLLPLYCAAVQSYTPVIADPILEPWRWREEEELSGQGVLCMAEAADGTLWFGSGGITRYDGMSVTRIPFDDDFLSKIVHDKRNPKAKALTILPDGSALILIGESLVHRSDGEWNVIIKDVGISVFAVGLKQAEDGAIWLLVPGSLWRVSADLDEATVVMTSSKGGFLGSFCFDPDGNVWVAEKTDASHAQLVRFSNKTGRFEEDSKGESYPVFFETDAEEIWLTAGKEGRIWYADDSASTALALFDPKENVWSWCAASPEERYFSLSTGKDGTIWAGGEKLIFRVPPEGEPSFYSRENLQLPQVPLSMYETDNNRLWVIGRVGYVYSVDIGFNQWKTYDQLHFQCETSEGMQWFRSKQKDGVVSHDPISGAWIEYDKTDGLIDEVFAINDSSHGLIWATGIHKGRAALAVFDGTNWERMCHPEFASWIEPKAVMEALDGTMWFGAGGPKIPGRPLSGGALQYGVNEHGKAHLIRHQQPIGFPYYVTSIAQAPDRAIWFGSTLIYRYDDSSQAARPVYATRGLNTVDMVFDHDDTLWIAKEHAGVYQLQGDSWKLFSTPEGLAGLTLSDLLVLHDGTVLASSGAGVSRYDGKTWTTHAYPEWWSMSRRYSGMHQSADGSVWFNIEDKEAQPAQLVLNQIEPFRTIRHRAETTPPETHVIRYLKRVAQPGNTHITWSAHDPWGESSSEQLQYSWRLDDDEWSAFSHETSQTFLNLPSGSHRLEVCARDHAFNVDPTPDWIEFAVSPPIWMQAWFITLITSFSALIVVLVWMYVRVRERHLMEKQQDREKHLKEMDQLKTSFFTNISHELRTPVTLITGPLNRLLDTESDEQKRTMLSMALRNATRVWNLATQLLDFRKLEQGKMEVVLVFGKVAPCVSGAVDLFQLKVQTNHVDYRTVCDEKLEGYFDPEMLKKIIQNLVGNAIKYTAMGGAIAVTLEGRTLEGQRMMILAVEDTGLGIKPEHLQRVFDRFYRVPEKSIVDGSGIGLHLTKELVDILGGSIKAESPIHDHADRPGSRFTVVLPLDGNQTEKDETNKVHYEE